MFETRSVSEPPFVIFYHLVDGDVVEIVRVIDKRRDHGTIDFD